MNLAELATVRHRVQLGQPLPFGVYAADRTLLLARGHVVDTAEHLEALLSRGALVDLTELLTPAERIAQAPRGELPRLWQEAAQRLSRTLLLGSGDGSGQAVGSFRTALADAAHPVQALVARDPDLAIFHVLRQGAGADMAYGTQRSMQTAITALLVSQRLAWAPEECERAFKVALTMNLSMLELQGQLARQTVPPSPQQREQLQTHPMRSVRLLEQAGVGDATWLTAVLRHHEVEDGSGYPAGTTEVGELASLVRRCDVYTSKLASRSHRDAITADLAGRQMFMQDPGHPMVAALVKEFGIYPPGSHVRLASGELAIVVARGEVITAPTVLCLTNARGMPLAQPQRMHTTDKAHAVVGVVGEAQLPVRAPLDRLLAALAA